MAISWKQRKIAVLILAATFVGFGIMFLLCYVRTGRSLRFERSRVDLGVLDFNTRVKVSFPFRNVSSRPVEIHKVVADCACTYVGSDKRIVLPGESGAIELSFQSRNQRGPVSHNVLVLTNALGQEQIKLTILGLVDPKLEVIPRAISFGHVRDFRGVASREILVVSRLEELPRITDISSSNPYIKAILLRTERTHRREVGRVKIELLEGSPVKVVSGIITICAQAEDEVLNCSVKVVAHIDIPADSISSNQSLRNRQQPSDKIVDFY